MSAIRTSRRDSRVETLEPRQLLHAGHEAAELQTLRVDAGSTVAYTDSLGHVWQADTGFTGGGTDNKTFTVAGTNDPKIYTSRRAGEFTYSNPTADGDYTLNLYFADWVTTAGTRTFNVSAEGQQILSNFDVAKSGGAQHALIKSFPITVTGGMLDLAFTKIVGNPVLSAFELIPVAAPDPLPPDAPSILSAQAGSDSTINLNWTDNADNETGFEIWRSTDGVNFSPRGIAPVNATTYADTGLTASTHYYYRVRAINNFGESAFTNDADAATLAPPPPQSLVTLRVDAAGTKGYLDSGGKSWSQDTGFVGGFANTSTFNVNGTTDDALYATRRTGDFTYSAAAPNGDYTLRLLFADYLAPGQRKFNVSVEGQQVLTNFDISGTVGANNAYIKTFNVTISDGKLDLAFKSVVGNAALSAFELTPGTTVIPPDPPPSDMFTKITWSTVAAAPVGKAEALRAVVDGKLYVFAGFAGNDGPIVRSDVYDPATNAWTRIADMPTRLSHAGVAVDGHDVYFAGGYIGTGPGYVQQFGVKDVWKYNVDSNTYTKMPDLPAALAGGGLVLVGRELHYFGGNNSSRQDVAVHYALKIDNLAGGWTSRKSMITSRSHMGYVNFAGKIYAIGGQKGNDAALVPQNLVEVYDPATDMWTSKMSMPKAINHISSSTFVMGNRILTMGGQTTHGSAIADCYAYDVAADKWVSLSPLPAARFSGVAAQINGTIYFSGGSSQTTTWKGIAG